MAHARVLAPLALLVRFEAAALLTGWILGLLPSVCAADHWTNADLTIFELLGDPEALGVGAATALRGTGARAATGNPAGLVETRRNEAVVDLSGRREEPWLTSVTPDITMETGHGLPQAIAYAHSFGPYAVGLGFERTYCAHFKVGGNFAEDVRYRMEAYQVAGAWRASDHVFLGLGARLVNGTGSDTYPNFPLDPAPNRQDSQTGFGVSLGARAILPRLRLAFLAEGGTNLKSVVSVPSFAGAFPETLMAHQPLFASLGAEYELHPLIQVLVQETYFNRHHYGSGYTYRDTAGQVIFWNPFRSTFEGSLGVEIKPQANSPLRVRGGLLLRASPWRRRAILDYNQAFLTFGVGLKTSRMRVDLAVASSDPLEDAKDNEIEQTHWSGGAVFSF